MPVGKLRIIRDKTIKLNVEFYSDFSQLKYVFAEVTTTNQIDNSNIDNSMTQNIVQSTEETKIKKDINSGIVEATTEKPRHSNVQEFSKVKSPNQEEPGLSSISQKSKTNFPKPR